MNADIEELCKDAKKLMNIVEMHLTAIKETFTKYKTAAVAAQLGFFAAGTANIDDVIKPYTCICCGSKSAVKPEWRKYIDDMKLDPDAECEAQNNVAEVEK